MWCTNRLLRHTNSDFYGIRTPPFMPYEPFLLGVGVAFNLLMFCFVVGVGEVGAPSDFLKQSIQHNVQLRLSGEATGKGVFPDTFRWKRFGNPWSSSHLTFWEPPDVGLAEGPPHPPLQLEHPSLKPNPFPPPPSPFLFPRPPLALFCNAPGRGGPVWCGGGVLGCRGGGWRGGPSSGSWGQTHIWGHSNFLAKDLTCA